MEGNDTKSRNPSGNEEREKCQGKPSGEGGLDKLSKEELIAKCRNLLAIAKKAKTAKDEATAEVKKLKSDLKGNDAANSETEALREMVADLTDGKIAFTTKIDSLQRQLKVSSSEIESLRQIESALLRERNQLVAENRHLAEEKAHFQDKVVSLKTSLSEKFKLSERSWEKERLAFEEKVENLEAQNGQVDILKTKCRKLLDEKTSVEEELQKQQKLVAKGIKLEGEVKLLKEEKKADAIIFEAAKNDRKKLEEKIKSLESQVVSLQREKVEGNGTPLEKGKVQALEEELRASKALLCDSEAQLKEAKENIEKLQQEKEVRMKEAQEAFEKLLQEKEFCLRESQEKVEKLQQEREAQLKEAENKLETLQQDKDKLKKTIQEMQENCESAKHNVKVAEEEAKNLIEEKLVLEKKIEDLMSGNESSKHNFSSQIEELKAKLSEAEKERESVNDTSCQKIQEMKTQYESKIEQMQIDCVKMKEQIGALQVQLNEKSKMNNVLENTLKEKCEEITRVCENLEQVERIKSDLEESEKVCKEKLEGLEKLLQSAENEKSELSKKYEILEADTTSIKERLENTEMQNKDLENALSKYESEVSTKSKENDSHRENADKLSAEVMQLNSRNDELSSVIANLEEDVRIKESIISEVDSLRSSLFGVCGKLYPKCFNPSSCHDGTVQSLKDVIKCMNEVAEKQDNNKYVELLEYTVESFNDFQRYCEAPESDWSNLSEGFSKICKNVKNFSVSLTSMTDFPDEKSVQLEKSCSDAATAYDKVCMNVAEKYIRLNDVEKALSDARDEIQKLTEQLFKAKEEKRVLEETLNEAKEGMAAAESRCTELENQVMSGDSQKAEVVKSLQEQILSVKYEKDTISEKAKESEMEKSSLMKSLEERLEEIERMQVEADAATQAKKMAESEKEHLQNALETLRSQGSTAEKCLSDEKQDLEKKLTILSEEKIQLEKEYASLMADKKCLEDEVEREKRDTGVKVTELLEEKHTWERERENQEEENRALQKDKSQLQKRIEDLDGEVKHLHERVDAMSHNIKALENEKEVSEKSLKETHNENLQLKESLEASGSRCEELLSELNDMNRVLRERGERISRLEASIKEKSEQLDATKSQLSELQNKMSSSEAELASKQEQLQTITEKLQSYSSDTVTSLPSTLSPEVEKLTEQVKDLEQEKSSLSKTIKTLENELLSLKENGGPCHDGQSEVMSTSTISRAEDSQRMKELEDTFEERYMKLKSVAIRLKKRVAELTAQLNSAEESRSKLASEKEDLKKKVDSGATKDTIKATTKNIQIMQGEIDRIQDEVDNKKKELKECGKQLGLAAEQLAGVKSQLAESQEENANLLRTVKTQEENLVAQRDEASSLRGQIAALEKHLAAEAEQQLTIEERRKKAEEQMEEQRQKASQYARELEEAKQDIKNKSLMDLEMRDYELTVEDLNGKLAEKEAAIIELQEEVVREKSRSNSLQDQLTHLTSQEATERDRADKMKKLLLDQKTQLAELRQSQDVQLAAHENDRVNIEELTQEVEKQKLVLSEISKEKTKLEDMLRKTKLSSERQIELLEEQLAKYKSETTQLRSELDTTQKEFEGYKVRAASVLRQKARAPEVDVNELKGEKDQLQENYEAAHLRIQQLQSELSALRAEHSFLQSEKEGIVRQVSSLTEDLARRESLHREKVTSLESKIEAKATEYQLIIASMSSQNETMSNSFKKQFETIRQTHARELEQLANKLEDTEDKLWQLKNKVSTSAPPANGSSTSSGLAVAPSLRSEPDQSNVSHNHTHQHRRQLSSQGCEEPRIDVSNMVREEGEGSEWVEPVHRSPSRPGGYSPPPLEQLINSPLPSNVGPPPQEDTVSLASVNTDATYKEIARLEAKISSSETRIHQLTSLLHESEAENAKLAQLSDALKEEIRRSSRNESREKHMENMEYMKNIILKFLVMKSGEERKHMVPVLKTVLQLSPQETSDLEHFAVGGDEGSGNQGWGSYLHLWSSR